MVINENWGRMAKIGFLGQKPKFWAQKTAVTFGDSPCSGHDRKKLFKEKSCLCPNNQGGNCHFSHSLRINYLSSPRAKRAGPKGLRAESARAVTGRRNSHRWEGGRLVEPSAGFFYGNSCNSKTKSRKIVSKVGN